MSRAPTKASVAANQATLTDRIVLRTSHAAGRLVNHTEAAIALAPVGYEVARTKHDLAARVAAGRAFAATL